MTLDVGQTMIGSIRAHGSRVLAQQSCTACDGKAYEASKIRLSLGRRYRS
jgi:hypothetical protein